MLNPINILNANDSKSTRWVSIKLEGYTGRIYFILVPTGMELRGEASVSKTKIIVHYYLYICLENPYSILATSLKTLSGRMIEIRETKTNITFYKTLPAGKYSCLVSAKQVPSE